MWQTISWSLIGLLIIAVRNFQQFFDRSFASAYEAYEPIFTLELDWTVKCNFQNTKRPPEQ